MTPGESLLRQMLTTIDMPVKASYTVRECCALLQITRMTLYRLRRAGDLQAIHMRRSIRVPFAALAAYLTRQSNFFRDAM